MALMIWACFLWRYESTAQSGWRGRDSHRSSADLLQEVVPVGLDKVVGDQRGAAGHLSVFFHILLKIM